MKVLTHLSDGFRYLSRFPSLVLWIYLAGLLLVMPLTLGLRSTLEESIGASRVHENLRAGFDLDWYGEFAHQNRGIADTFGPSVVGILPVLRNIESLLDGEILGGDYSVALTGVLFLLLWAFFAGGILDRYAHPRESHSRSRFFATGGKFFFPLLRLLILSVLFYLALFRWVADPLHSWIQELTRDVTVERTVILYTMLIYAGVGMVLLLFSMVHDYAKIALVVERRRSALLALLRGLVFALSNWARCLSLFLCLALVGLVLFLFYGLFAPGPGQSTTLTLALAFLVGQAYLLARIALKLWFLASQTSLFRAVRAEPAP